MGCMLGKLLEGRGDDCRSPDYSPDSPSGTSKEIVIATDPGPRPQEKKEIRVEAA